MNIYKVTAKYKDPDGTEQTDVWRTCAMKLHTAVFRSISEKRYAKVTEMTITAKLEYPNMTWPEYLKMRKEQGWA